jgi:hypothetical protein
MFIKYRLSKYFENKYAENVFIKHSSGIGSQEKKKCQYFNKLRRLVHIFFYFLLNKRRFIPETSLKAQKKT